MTKPTSIPALPADAVGFIARRVDRPERLALFRADGSLSNTFAVADTLDTLRPVLAVSGLIVDAAGIVTR
jgi:hypothetical protein